MTTPAMKGYDVRRLGLLASFFPRHSSHHGHKPLTLKTENLTERRKCPNFCPTLYFQTSLAKRQIPSPAWDEEIRKYFWPLGLQEGFTVSATMWGYATMGPTGQQGE